MLLKHERARLEAILGKSPTFSPKTMQALLIARTTGSILPHAGNAAHMRARQNLKLQDFKEWACLYLNMYERTNGLAIPGILLDFSAYLV